MKRIITALICAVLLASALCSGAVVDVEAPSAILIHTSGKVLYEKDAHKPMEPASVTKVMTLLLVFEAIDRGVIGLDDVVTVSANASGMGGSQVYLKEGEQFPVDTMIKCVAVASANDCSVALAEHISGSESAFVEKMNSRAKELGMENTNFVNCHGLTADGHLTSAYDIALMSIELMKHEKIRDYTLIWQDTIRNGEFTLTNTNRLVRTFDGITGLKTGSTATAGFCVAATASRDGLDLVAVVMKAASTEVRNQQAAQLLSYGFANYASVSLTSDTPIMPVEVTLGKQATVSCVLADTGPGVYEKSKLASVEKEIVMQGPLTAPVAKGTQVGEMIVRAGDEVIATVPIVTGEDVARKGIIDIFADLLKVITMRVV